MHLLKHLLALVLVAFAFAPPAEAGRRGRAPPLGPVERSGYATGMHSTDVEPIVKGMVAMSVHIVAYWGCFLALDNDDTCIKVAGHARDSAMR